eukprot:3585212-Prymnesium_polylepis.1
MAVHLWFELAASRASVPLFDGTHAPCGHNPLALVGAAQVGERRPRALRAAVFRVALGHRARAEAEHGALPPLALLLPPLALCRCGDDVVESLQ